VRRAALACAWFAVTAVSMSQPRRFDAMSPRTPADFGSQWQPSDLNTFELCSHMMRSCLLCARICGGNSAARIVPFSGA
jgi:hypothetical protein